MSGSYAHTPLSIFRRREVFEEAHVPEEFLYREKELEEIASCIRPLLQGVQGNTMKIYGEPATGKTTSIKKIFAQVPESNIACVYVNAMLRQSAYTILGEIAMNLGGQNAMPDKSTGTVKLVDIIMRLLIKNGRSIVLCIDEYSYLSPRDIEAVIAPFLRPWEFGKVSKGLKSSVLLISTSVTNPSIRSSVINSIGPHTLQFKPYSFEQKYDILYHRAEAGFGKNVVEDVALEIMAGINVRWGIQTLKLTGEIADTTGETKITGDIASRALNRLEGGMNANSVLNSTEKVILHEISQRGKMFAGEIYSFSLDKLGLKKTRTYEILQRLLKLGILEATEHNHRGRTRIFKPVQESGLNGMS
ncbi:cell division control protein 6 [archaeon]|nr:cell division control protein 6 [archaeon]